MNEQRFRDRLREVVRPRGVAAETEATADGSNAAGAPATDTAAPTPCDTFSNQARASSAAPSLEAVLGGEWQGNESRRALVVEHRVPADTCHGTVRVGELGERLLRSARETRAWVDGARAPFLFFDLETTGLNGGAGTLAFLVGFGSFETDGSFVTRQYVLTRPGDERPMLQAVAERLSTVGALVSFNGKSFDAPLLETRFLFHRLSWVGAAVPHLDVLHPARRFWRAEVTDTVPSPCSLQALERQVLGAPRHDDVPGLEAPARYFQFIRSGDAAPLAGVLAHNRLDLLSLAGLTARLLALVDDGPRGAGTGREALALGGIYERSGRFDQAHQAYEQALALVTTEESGRRRPSRSWSPASLDGGEGGAAARMSAAGRLQVEILRALARSARRAGRYEEAARWWRDVLDRRDCPTETAREAAEALAIHHEHRRRDLESARTFALRTLEVTPSAVRHAAVRHRLARLDRKLSERPTLFRLGGDA